MTPEQATKIGEALNDARERCKASAWPGAYERNIAPCKDMLRTKIEEKPSTVVQAAHQLSHEFEVKGDKWMSIWIMAAASELLDGEEP